MRISDWSSDVCSSDLQLHEALQDAAPHLLVLGPADRDDPATFFALGDPAWTHCGADSSCRSPAACCPGPDAVRAPRRRARMAIAAAKIASFDAMAAASVPAIGALDLRHPDLEMAIPARAPLPSRGGRFGVPAPEIGRGAVRERGGAGSVYLGG